MELYHIDEGTPVQRHVKLQKAFLNQSAFGTKESYMSRYREFWYHPIITPQQQAAEWDTDCLSLFIHTEAALAFLDMIMPGQIPLEYRGAQLPYTVEYAEGLPTGRIIIN